MNSATTTSSEFFTCPACDMSVVGTVAFTLTLTGKIEGKTATVETEVTGTRVQHDCIPKVTR